MFRSFAILSSVLCALSLLAAQLPLSPEPRLSVELVGTVVTEPASFSSALLTLDGITEGYQVGAFAADLEVVQIKERAVVLRDTSGALHELQVGS